MTRTVLRAFAIMSVSSTLLLLYAQAAGAQPKKVTGTGKVDAALSETEMLPGDDPNHAIKLARMSFAYTSDDPLIGNFKSSVVEVSDYTAGNGMHRGWETGLHDNGDKLFFVYDGVTKTVLKTDRAPDITFEGRWRYTGGTGRFAGITGEGTYKGQVGPAGVAWQWSGEYEIKK